MGIAFPRKTHHLMLERAKRVVWYAGIYILRFTLGIPTPWRVALNSRHCPWTRETHAHTPFELLGLGSLVLLNPRVCHLDGERKHNECLRLSRRFALRSRLSSIEKKAKGRGFRNEINPRETIIETVLSRCKTQIPKIHDTRRTFFSFARYN